MKIPFFYLIFSLSLIFCGQFVQAQEFQELEPNKPIERKITGGESHNYQIKSTIGQFFHITALQKEINVTLILSSPDGKQVTEMNFNRSGAFESLSDEAAANGNYKLTVRANNSNGLTGFYLLKLETRLVASETDKKRIAAERLMIEATVLVNQGRKSAEPALEKLQQVIAVWRELKEPYWVAWAYLKIGGANNGLGRYEKALEADEEALKIYRELKDRAGEGVAINDIGGNNYRLNRYDKSLEFFEKGLDIAGEVGDKIGEAISLNNIGIANYGLSRFEKAIEFHEKALKLAREINDEDTEGRALNSLGVINRRIGRYDKAIEYYEQALGKHRKDKDRSAEGIVLNNLSGVYANQDRYEKAIEYLESSLVIWRELKNRAYERIALGNLCNFYLNLKLFDKSILYGEQALALSRELKDRDGESNALHNLGDVFYDQKQYLKAIDYITKALSISRELKDSDSENAILYSLARAEREHGNLSSARIHIEESLKITESMRSDLLSPAARASYLGTVQKNYQFYTNLLMRLHKVTPDKGFDALAVEVSERQRARSLLDLLAESKTDLRQGVAANLIEDERKIAKQLNDKAQQETKTPEQSATLKREISQLETALERVQVAIRNASPHYAALTQPQPLKLADIQSQLDENTLLLEYALGDDQSYLWAITKDSLNSYELPKEDDIKEKALSVYELLVARNTKIKSETALQRKTRISSADAKLPVAAKILSDIILKPAAGHFGNKRLVIIADGALQYIPFAMLPDPMNSKNQSTGANFQPLVISHEIINLPSASTLAIQRNELKDRQPAPKTLAIFADPVFDKTDLRFKTAPREKNDKNKPELDMSKGSEERGLEYIADANANGKLVIRRLPFTENEATGLLALAPKNSSFAAIGFQANRETVMSGELANYRYIHFATHGLLDTERPGLSSLILSLIDEKGKAENGFLRANDIYNLKLPAELVVLSACQTGLGKEIKGEGLIGLTRGFMYAGAKRVVVSLWSVNDKATAELMERFYRGMLKENKLPAAALRTAQIQMWKEKAWQSPYFWSSFIIQGDWH
jgi:CHAT domain-containing protein/Flp pilus assembly protein TadD